MCFVHSRKHYAFWGSTFVTVCFFFIFGGWGAGGIFERGRKGREGRRDAVDVWVCMMKCKNEEEEKKGDVMEIFFFLSRLRSSFRFLLTIVKTYMDTPSK